MGPTKMPNTRNSGVILNSEKVQSLARELYGITTEHSFLTHLELSGLNVSEYAAKKSWSGISGKRGENGIRKKQALYIATFLQSELIDLLHYNQTSLWAQLLEKHSGDLNFLQFKYFKPGKRELVFTPNQSHDDILQVPINSQWYITLEGSPGDNFFILIRSRNQIWQLAPTLQPGYHSKINDEQNLIQFPNDDFLAFRREDGLGWREIIAIRSKTCKVEAGEGFRQLFEDNLNKIAFSLQHSNHISELVISRLQFNLVP